MAELDELGMNRSRETKFGCHDGHRMVVDHFREESYLEHGLVPIWRGRRRVDDSRHYRRRDEDWQDSLQHMVFLPWAGV